MTTDDGSTDGWTSPSEPTQPPPQYGAPPPKYGAPPPMYGAPPPMYGAGPSWGLPQAPKPGVIPLRPLGVGEILDGAFTTIRRYPAATLGMAAIVMLAVVALQVVLSYALLHGLNRLSDDFDGRDAIVQIVTGLVTIVATSLLSGGIAAVIGEGALGRPMSAGQALAQARHALPRLLGSVVLIFLIIVGIVLVGIVPGLIVLGVGSTGAGAALIAIGAIAAFVVVIYLSVGFSFTTPIVMLEKQKVRAAISRSRQLVKGGWWRIFGITLLAGLITGVITGLFEIPFSLASGLSSYLSGSSANTYTFTALLLQGIGTLLASTLVRPFAAGATALLYLDSRMRREGLDLTLQAAAAAPA